MCLLIVVLVLFGSFSSSLSGEKCRFHKIYTEVLRYCKGSEFTGCKSELTDLGTFLKVFLGNTEFFCNLPRLKGYCKPCSINGTLSDLIATNSTGNGTTNTGN